MAQHRDMAEVITTEMGSPITFSNLAQAPAPWMMLNSFLDVARELPVGGAAPGRARPDVIVRSEPVGVVAAIVPVERAAVRHDVEAGPGAARRAAPSSSSRRPRRRSTRILMAELLDEAGIPTGVVSVVPAGPRGRRAPRAPPRHRQGRVHRVDRGRAAASRRSAVSSSSGCSLELGGKSAAIILDDADLAATVEGLKFASLMNNGQACVAQTRILASRAALRRGRRRGGRDGRRAAGRRSVRCRHRDRPARRQAPAGAGREVHRARPGRGRHGRRSAATACRPASTRAGTCSPTVFANVDNDMRIAQRGDLRPGARGHPLRRRRRRGAHRQRQRVRPGRFGVDRRPRGRASTSPAGSAPAPTA